MTSPPGHRDRHSGAFLELLDTLNHPVFFSCFSFLFLLLHSWPFLLVPRAASSTDDLGGGLNHYLFANVKIVFQPLKFHPRRSVLQLAHVSHVRGRGRGQTLDWHPSEHIGLYRMPWSPGFYVFYERQL